MNDEAFDKQFESMFNNVQKTQRRILVPFVVAWLLSIVTGLGLTVGLAYVAWHFISKLW